MAGYLGSRPVVVQVDGYQREESESRYVNVSGDDFSGHLDFVDDAKARFGSSDELHIYTESSGSGHSYIQGDNIVIRSAAGTARLTVTSNDVDVSSGALKVGGTTVIDSSRNGSFGTVTASGGSTNNDDNANILTLNASEHARLLIDTSSTGGHRATLALESNGNETQLTTTGSASYLNVASGDLTLDVAGDIILDADGKQIIFADGGTQFGQISTNTTPADMAIKSLISDKDIIFQGIDGSSTINALTLDMSEAGAATFNAGVSIGSSDDNPFNWGGSSNNVSISSAGNNDWAQLSLKGNGTGGTGINLGSGSVRHAGIFSLNGSTLAFATNPTNSGTTTSTAMTILSNGNVGINDSSPQARFVVQGDNTAMGTARFQPDSNKGTNTSHVHYGTTGDWYIRSANAAGSVILQDATSATGFVRIGQTSVNYPGNGNSSTGISLTNTGRISASFNGDHVFNRNSDGILMSWRRSGAEYGSVSVSTSGTTYNTTSDRRLKTDIQPIEGATATLMAMAPVTHKWKAHPSAPAVYGFIAQDMQALVPEAVSGDPDSDEMMSMDYGRITPVLVAALQDAHNKITALEKRLAELEAN